MKVAIAGAGGRLGFLLFGLLQRLAQEQRLTGVNMPVGLVGTPAGAKRLSKGLYRHFGMAFAPEQDVCFVDAADLASWQRSYAECDALILGDSYELQREKLPPKFLQQFSLVPLHEHELYMDGVANVCCESDALLTAQLAGAASANVDRIIIACPGASAERLDALAARVISSGFPPSSSVQLVATPRGAPLIDTPDWTYLTPPAEPALRISPIAAGIGIDAELTGQEDVPLLLAAEEYARLLVSLATSQEPSVEAGGPMLSVATR